MTSIEEQMKQLVTEKVCEITDSSIHILNEEHQAQLTTFRDATVDFLVEVIDWKSVCEESKEEYMVNRLANDFMQILTIVLKGR